MRWLCGLPALAVIGGCSLLAPGDDEFLGGSAGSAAAGGVSVGGSGGATAGGSGGVGATGGSGGSSAMGGSAGSGGVGAAPSGGGTSGGSGGSGGATCVPAVGTATPRPVELYLLLHRSATLSNAQWASVKNQVSQFASAASNVSAGLQYVPPAQNGDCNGAGYATPAVPFGPLPQNAAAIDLSLGVTTVGSGGTQFEGAANGLMTLGATRVAASPATQFSAVLIVTGNWYGCTMSAPAVASILAQAWPSVSTYVIGAIGATAAELDLMASAGGTVVRLGSSGTLSSSLAEAARPCQFELPAGFPPANVSLTLNGGTTPALLEQRPSATACGATDGWFVSPNSSQTAALCPASCRKAIATAGSSVDYATSCN